MNIDKDIEELAFKDRKKLANLNVIDLLDIIEFLQIDRKHWINQYTNAHNDYVCLQQENTKLKDELNLLRHYRLVFNSHFGKTGLKDSDIK